MKKINKPDQSNGGCSQLKSKVFNKQENLAEVMNTKKTMEDLFKDLRILLRPENNNPRKLILIGQYVDQLEEYIQGTFMSPEEQETHKKKNQEKHKRQSSYELFLKLQDLLNKPTEDIDRDYISSYISKLTDTIDQEGDNYIPGLTAQKLEEIKKQLENQ